MAHSPGPFRVEVITREFERPDYQRSWKETRVVDALGEVVAVVSGPNAATNADVFARAPRMYDLLREREDLERGTECGYPGDATCVLTRTGTGPCWLHRMRALLDELKKAGV